MLYALSLFILNNPAFSLNIECVYTPENLWCGKSSINITDNLQTSNVTELVLFSIWNLSNAITNEFPYLKNLTIHASRNAMIVTEFPSYGQSLTNLNLGGNFFKKINEKAFQYSSELKTLDMSANLFESFNKTDFYGLTNLTLLNLQQNLLKILNLDIIIEMPKLQKLWVQYNQIGTIQKINNSEIEKSVLKELNLSFNKLWEDEPQMNIEKIFNESNIFNDQRLNQSNKNAGFLQILSISVNVVLVLIIIVFFVLRNNSKKSKKQKTNPRKFQSIFSEISIDPYNKVTDYGSQDELKSMDASIYQEIATPTTDSNLTPHASQQNVLSEETLQEMYAIVKNPIKKEITKMTDQNDLVLNAVISQEPTDSVYQEIGPKTKFSKTVLEIEDENDKTQTLPVGEHIYANIN